jgi:hypothetical protein
MTDIDHKKATQIADGGGYLGMAYLDLRGRLKAAEGHAEGCRASEVGACRERDAARARAEAAEARVEELERLACELLGHIDRSIGAFRTNYGTTGMDAAERLRAILTPAKGHARGVGATIRG